MEDLGTPRRTPAASSTENRLLAGILLLMVVPTLFFSSAGPVAWAQLAAAVLAACLFRTSFPTGPDRRLKAVSVAMLVVFAASWLGALGASQSLLRESLLALGGLATISGMAVFLATLLRRPEWIQRTVRTLAAILFFLLALSYGGYFLPLERLIPIGDMTMFFEPTRLCLIWPTRLAMGWCGQIGWGHANHAGLLFVLGLVFVLDLILSGRAKRRPLWWFAAIMLGTCIFLTGSRGSLLVLLAALPWLWLRRPAKGMAVTLAAITASTLLGVASLKVKEELMKPATVPQQEQRAGDAPEETPPNPSVPETLPAAPEPAPVEKDIHIKGLVERGTAGRESAYLAFWKESPGHRLLGRGLTETSKSMFHLNHEHSSYLATFRSGGFVALTAHLFILGMSAWCALLLFLREGIRWPILLLSATLAALLFDRSSVFIPSGFYEVPLHWIAVLCPLLLRSLPRPSAPDPAVR